MNASRLLTLVPLTLLTLAVWTADTGRAQEPERAVAGAHCPGDIRTIALTPQSVARTLPKAPRYTQGLVVHGDRLYESAGMFGHSGIFASPLDGTDWTRLAGLGDALFGEGLAVLDDTAYYLTWRAQQAYVYDVNQDGTLTASDDPPLRYAGEGWGLATYGQTLLLSDGTPNLRVVDPADFNVAREITVRAGARPVNGLNELEVIGEQVLANLYGPPVIVVIDIGTGCVRTALDATPLARAVQPSLPAANAAVCGSFGCTATDYVLNGIAYDGKRDELYLTGKNWPRVYVFANPLTGSSADREAPR